MTGRPLPPLPGASMAALVACSTLLATVPCHSQVPEPPPRPSARLAREALVLYLRSGRLVPYEGEQITRSSGPRSLETRQLVKYGGPRRQRFEYVEPPRLAGEIVLISGSRVLRYIPKPTPHIVEADAALADDRRQLQWLYAAVRDRRMALLHAGTQLVAGRLARIVELRPANGGSYKRLWIDLQNGARLKQETVSADGVVLSSSYFTRITFLPGYDARDFLPESLPAARIEAEIPSSPPLGTIAEAERTAGYRIRTPVLHPRYALTGCWVLGPRQRPTVLLRYSDGVMTITFSQRPLPRGLALLDRLAAQGMPRIRRGVAVWISGDRVYTLVGNLPPAAVERIARTLR